MSATLDQVVAVRGRFHRSVNLAADWDGAGSLAEYLATETVVEVADGILQELDDDVGARAWSITGPYGSGKSAFAVFLCDVLAKAKPDHPKAARLRQRHKLEGRRFDPVLVTAERGPIAPVLLKALGGRGNASNPSTVVAALMAAAQRSRQKRRSGLLLVIDELGKFLEYAALHPHDADVFLLQQLAEAATRSAVPVVFLTVLHSGFADYLPATEEVRRSEWRKVQGRFRDIPFQLPADQILELVGSALETELPRAMQKGWAGEIRDLVELAHLGDRRKDITALLERCLPLHPLTSLLLWPLFRSKGAQNERSLFAFLTSREPHGLRDYLASTLVSDDAQPYRPAQLFDYIQTALGIGAFRGDQARRWALADQAIGRLPGNAPASCADVVKSVALLSVYGSGIGIAPTPALIELAIGDKESARRACDYLTKASVLVYRKHADSYSLWEGSDFDLEAAHERALVRLRGAGSLAQRLHRLLEVRPLVARRHYIETGTLRWFEVALATDLAELAMAASAASDADGKLVFWLGDDLDLKGVEAAQGGAFAGPVILVHPHDTAGVAHAIDDLEAWQYVSDHSLELASDPVARQEVRARLSAARERLESLIGATLGLPGQVIEPARSRWFYAGKHVELQSAPELQAWLSSLCGRVFKQAPTLRNELLNRMSLSSASAAARRTLIQRMIEDSTKERLGIDGWPPEAAMYESMLRSSGIHRPAEGRWAFGRPSSNWSAAWDTCVSFIRSAAETRRPITDLFELLRRPPFGLKDGLIPVLLCAVLISLGDEVALYEDGVFVPELRIEAFERLLRRPENFELRFQALTGANMKLVKALAQALQGASGLSQSKSTVALVRSLVVGIASLPPYARQTRRRMSPEAVRVREQLLSATDPTKLLFVDLPTACGVRRLSTRAVPTFVVTLTKCIGELTSAYPRLLDEIEESLRSSFSLSKEALVAQQQLRQISEPLVAVATEPRLQVFVREAARDQTGRDWRESLARAINGGLPATHWKDSDVAAFQLRLAELRGDITRLEEMTAEQRRTGVTRVVRLSVVEPQGGEVRELVSLRGGTDAEVDALVQELNRALWQNPERSGDARRLRLEALGRVAAELLLDIGEEART